MRTFLFGLAAAACWMLTSCAEAQPELAEAPPPIVPAAPMSAPPVKADKIFLRNLIYFAGERRTAGATSVLIDIDGIAHVLTAKHLLGEAMGITPPVLPSKFESELELWLLFDNPGFEMLSFEAEYEPIAKVTGILKPDDNFDFDLMVLKTDVSVTELTDRIVKVADTPMKVGDVVSVIGCPYESEGCTGNPYFGRVIALEGYETMIAFDWISGPPTVSGFSGAAVLNQAGEVAAVVLGGNEETGIATPVPDWLKEAAN